MAKGRSLGPNGVMVKFFVLFWDLIREDFFKTIDFSIREGHLPKGVNKGSITFLFKARENENLGNWWSIFLINVAYKIYAKTLQ